MAPVGLQARYGFNERKYVRVYICMYVCMHISLQVCIKCVHVIYIVLSHLHKAFKGLPQITVIFLLLKEFLLMKDVRLLKAIFLTSV